MPLNDNKRTYKGLMFVGKLLMGTLVLNPMEELKRLLEPTPVVPT